jgi:7-keto-8-aminopelargonate synthetase-like enzyme
MNRENDLSVALGGSLLHHRPQTGRNLAQRTRPFWDWIEERRGSAVWPYFRVLEEQVGGSVQIANEHGASLGRCINFGSQDYLGLAQDPSIAEAVRACLTQFGVHSAGSPVLCGRTQELLRLERRIADLFGHEASLVFPTGWAAGFGVIAGLARRDDTVLMDDRSHNCLQEGARHATEKVRTFRHNDLEHLRHLLAEARAEDAENGVFVILESLYSMDSDSPDLRRALALAREFEAMVILDVAHDLGAMGDQGLGLLETLGSDSGPDVLMGSFSKTFAANGGFVACSRQVRTYLGCYAAPLGFSNAISPMQTAVVQRAFDITYSEQGRRLRAQLMENICALRAAMDAAGCTVGGTPSPICPVFVGAEPVARLTSRQLIHRGLLANLVEFPAVPRGHARFRFQVMATHTHEDIQTAARIMGEARAIAERDLAA